MATAKGSAFEHLRFLHPLYGRDSVGVLADYVTLDTGTGVVHTAPGHGADDFRTGLRYGLEIYAPIAGDGRFMDDVERFAGLTVFDANPKVEQALAEAAGSGRRERFEHSYPHCWRCHNPVIFLATSQWFIGMDDTGLRAKATAETAQGRVGAGVGRRAHEGHVRDAARLVHLAPALVGRADSGGHVHVVRHGRPDAAAGRARAELFEKEGAEAWYERPIEDFLPAGFACPSCGGAAFEREKDILDVWFDSGSSHEAVLAVHPELRWPADLYLEGNDQYRGWFQSSMLVGLGTRGRAPYHQVVTHGMVVTEAGKKMSKSLGNDVPPEQVIKQSGAESCASGSPRRLPRRSPIRARDPGARGRGLPQTPEHAPHSCGQPLRFRPGRRHAVAAPQGRSTGSRWPGTASWR